MPLPVTLPCPEPIRATFTLTLIWNGTKGGSTSPNATLAKVRMFVIVTVHLLLE
jgi:hypothetical protein